MSRESPQDQTISREAPAPRPARKLNAAQLDAIHRALTRIARFIDQLVRGQLSRAPITVQQSYALEALAQAPRTMRELAAEVALHQSTMTRVVEKLEKLGLATRARDGANRRQVVVSITDLGRALHVFMGSEARRMTAALIDTIPPHKRDNVLEAVEIFAEITSPHNQAFRDALASCCGGKAQEEQ